MSALPVWAGVIVRELAAATPWYVEATGARLVESTERWAVLAFADGSGLEVHEGDPERPGLTFPSYGGDPGPAVMPGFAVDDADESSAGLVIARSLPGWNVVLAPAGLRVVLCDRESDAERGVVGFGFSTPAPTELRTFLDRLGASGDVERSARPRVVPVVSGSSDAELNDPDGNPLRIARRRVT